MRNVYHEYGFIFEPETETPDLLAFGKNYGHQSGAFFVATRHEQIIGTAGIRFTSDTTAEVFRLYLGSTHRGQGIGRRLLATVIEWARRQQAQQLTLWSDTRFEDAHKLYLRAGFTQGSIRYTHDINDSVEYQFTLSL